MRTWTYFLFLLSLSPLPLFAQTFTCPTAPPAGATCNHPSEFTSCGLVVNGLTRHFCIHEPSEEPMHNTPPGTRMPAILAFHGGGGNANVMVNTWDRHTEQGMVLVAPTALPTAAGGAACPPNASTRWRHINLGVPDWAALANADPCGGTYRDDLDFVRALVAELRAQLDPSGFYAAGFSSGAGMVYQLMITEPHAGLFNGLAAVSNVLGTAKVEAHRATAPPPGAPPDLRPNRQARVPFLFMIGTNDKTNSPLENIVESVTRACAGPTPPSCAAACGAGATALDVMTCWRQEATHPGGGRHLMLTPRHQTAQWLVQHNNSVRRAVQSLYPDVGHGGPPNRPTDQTTVVREDYRRRGGTPNSAPVAVVTVLGGEHVWPGQNGDYPPCTNCDIDATQVILQFWRAQARLRSLWE